MRIGADAVAKRYWGCALGEGGKYVSLGVDGGYMAIGWDELPNPSRWQTIDRRNTEKWLEFRSAFSEAFPNYTPVRLGIAAGQVWGFVAEMMPGDTVVLRDTMQHSVHIGEVGEYKFVNQPADGCPYPNRRVVNWTREVRRSEMSERFRAGMNAMLSLWRMDDYVEYIAGTTNSTPPSNARALPTDLRRAIVDRLLALTPGEFEEFVGHLLTISGFSATVTQLVGDGGVDVIGVLNAEDLAEISLRVQVKRISGNSGNREILQLRGTLGPDEHGAFVTLGGFTRQAREEANADGRKPIRLIDGENLVDIILRNFDRLNDSYKDLLRLRRREVPLVEQFVASDQP